MSVKAIQIKLVDHNGRTKCKFWKQSTFDAAMQPQETEPWGSTAKPLSDKWLERDDIDDVADSGEGRAPQLAVQRRDGVRYLLLPGLTLRWEKVTPVLDRIAVALNLVDEAGSVLVDDMDAATLTIDQLRNCIGS